MVGASWGWALEGKNLTNTAVGAWVCPPGCEVKELVKCDVPTTPFTVLPRV